MSHYQDIILKSLKKGNKTSREISDETGISYLTVRKYIDELLKEEILIEVDKKKVGKKSTRSQTKRYSLNPKILNEKK